SVHVTHPASPARFEPEGGSLPANGSRVGRVMALAERLLLIAGIVLFVVLVYRLGPTTVWGNLRLIGCGFLRCLAQQGLSDARSTGAWAFACPPPRARIPFRTLLAARLGGEAINNLTPTATIGGEVVRGRMLDGVVDNSLAWASIAIAKLMQTFAQMGF